MVELTIGVIAADDLAVVSHCLNALRFSQDLSGTELVVLNRGVSRQLRAIVPAAGGQLLGTPPEVGLAGAWNSLFAVATGDVVLCLDASVSLAPDAVGQLLAYVSANPATPDLIHGARLDPAFDRATTAWTSRGVSLTGDPSPPEPVTVAFDDLRDGDAFEIPGHDPALFACRREAWPGLEPLLRGDAGLSGYLAIAFRQRGAAVRCLPSLVWAAGPEHAAASGEKNATPPAAALRNAVLARASLSLPLAPAIKPARRHLPAPVIAATIAAALGDRATTLRTISAGRRLPTASAGSAPALIQQGEPLISCLCPTSNRPSSGRQWLLEEAIESFLRQDYPNKELVVLNDTAGQILRCDAPGVRIINEPTRYPSIGAKRNALAARARGDLLCFWDDDDISLPWRLSLSRARLGDGAYANPRAHWHLQHGRLQTVYHGDNCAMMSLFTREAFQAMGGLPALNYWEDVMLDQRLTWYNTVVRGQPLAAEPLPITAWFYLYRVGVSDLHLSNGGANAWERLSVRSIQPGLVTLQPHWREDYVALVAAAARAEAR